MKEKDDGGPALELVSVPCPIEKGSRIVGIRIRPGDKMYGKYGLSEPLLALEALLKARSEVSS